MSTTTWPAAVSTRSAAILSGPVRRGRVLAAFPTALYLGLDEGGVLPVVTRRGLRLPTSVVVAPEADPVGWGVQPQEEVAVGGGSVRLPGLELQAVRVWRPRQIALAGPGEQCLPSSRGLPRVPGLSPSWRHAAQGLVSDLVDGRPVTGRVREFVGAGPGLTPSGDDVLCGVLLGLRLHSTRSARLVPRLWRAIHPRCATTTSLSAALLAEAAQGYAVPPVVRLADALAAGDAPAARAATTEVLAIGHTSGADLLAGLAGCLDAWGERETHFSTWAALTARSLP